MYNVWEASLKEIGHPLFAVRLVFSVLIAALLFEGMHRWVVPLKVGNRNVKKVDKPSGFGNILTSRITCIRSLFKKNREKDIEEQSTISSSTTDEDVFTTHSSATVFSQFSDLHCQLNALITQAHDLSNQLSDLISQVRDRDARFSELNAQSKIPNTDFDALASANRGSYWSTRRHALVVEFNSLSTRLSTLCFDFNNTNITPDTDFSALRNGVTAWKAVLIPFETKLTALKSDINKEMQVQDGESNSFSDAHHPLTIDSATINEE
jgi:hypothetical protein